MFNLSLRDESYDAKFYKYASAHGNKQQPPTSLSPLNGHNNHTMTKSNGCENRPTSTSPSACSPASPSSDDVLLALTSSAIQRAANGQSPRRSNGLNGAASNQSNGGTNGSANGQHMHLE